MKVPTARNVSLVQGRVTKVLVAAGTPPIDEGTAGDIAIAGLPDATVYALRSYQRAVGSR